MDKFKNILKKILFNAVIPIVVGFSTFLFTKKQYDEKVRSMQLENVQEVIKVYKTMANDLRQKVIFQRKQITQLRIEIKELKLKVE